MCPSLKGAANALVRFWRLGSYGAIHGAPTATMIRMPRKIRLAALTFERHTRAKNARVGVVRFGGGSRAAMTLVLFGEVTTLVMTASPSG